MANYTLRPSANIMDVIERVNGTFYDTTGSGGNMVVGANTTASGFRTVAGIRFPCNIPIGTTKIPFASFSGFTQYNNSAVGTPIPLKIYVEIPANPTTGPVAFPASAGANDLLSTVIGSATTSRVYSTNFTQVNFAGGPSVNFEFSLNPDMIKELLVKAGATGFGFGGDTHIATNGTTQDINDIVLFVAGDILATGPQLTFSLTSYDDYTTDSTATKNAKYFQVSCLNLVTGTNDNNVVGTDERVHVCIWGDSLTWPYAPDLQYGQLGYTRPQNTLYTTLDPSGNPDTIGIMKWGDGSSDIVPAGESYGGVNRGYVSINPTGSQWYTVIDPDGSVYNHGVIQPEARSGYTKDGCLKDRLAVKFGVRRDRIVIHHFGWGGSTADRTGGTSGIWNEVLTPSDAQVKLDTITDPTTALATITNPLWNGLVDQNGKTFVQVLMDSTIKNMICLGSVLGNELFLKYTGANGSITLPIAGDVSQGISDSLAAVSTAVTNMTASLAIPWNFIKLMRDHYATLLGAITEYHHVGYYNFLAQDPRVPPINVNIGAPALAHMHNGTYQSLANPDLHYGGPNPSAGSKMAPYGNTGQSHPAASPGVGSVNALPQVPMTYFYRYGPGSAFNLPAPQTNIVGQPANCNWTTPRAMTKDDLDIPHQLWMGDRMNKTWVRDFDSNWRDFFAHWAADTSYSNSLYSQAATTGGWDNAFAAFQNNIFVGSFPWHSCHGSSGAPTGSPGPTIPLNNMHIAIPYTGRNVNNATVNGVVQATCSVAQAAVMTTLKSTAPYTQWIDMHDCLPAQVGSGVTASADRWAYHEGVHPTMAASIIMSDEYLARAMAGGSPLLQKLVAEAHSSMFLAMM